MRCNSSPILTQRQPFDIRNKEAEHNKSNSPRRQLSTAQQLLKARKESTTMVGAMRLTISARYKNICT